VNSAPNGYAPAVLRQALTYLDAGLSILPVARGGSKRPDMSRLPRVLGEDGNYHPTWDPFKLSLPARSDVEQWFRGSHPPGIGVISGAVSGALECIDFDAEAESIFPAWCELVEAEAPGLVARLSIARTPKPGFHVRYRCPDIEVPGNDKLAMDPVAAPDERCLVETRGEGGYAIAPGSPPECHKSGKLYEHHSGPPLEKVQAIGIEEREVLIQAARSFDRSAPLAAPRPGNPSLPCGTGLSPGTDFERRGPDWPEILQPHGWAVVFRRGQVTHWKRPGKDGPGCSATTGFCTGDDGLPRFYPFSMNAAPFEANRPYTKFGVYAFLNHGGDFSAAARALAQQGYGEPRPRAAPGVRAAGKAQGWRRPSGGGNGQAGDQDAEPAGDDPGGGQAPPGEGVANAVKDDKNNIIPFTMSHIMEQASTATGDWPRRVGGALFVHERGELSWIENSSGLFGYYGSRAGIVRWYKGLGCHSKEEVYQERKRTASSYQAVEALPHEPPLPGHYYACDTPASGDGQALTELLARFQPASVLDLDLLKAMWVTALWGGPGGARPAFVITSKHGRGSGKSKVAAMLGRTYGGVIDLAADEDIEIIKQRLLSPDGITKRIALLDNVKSWKFSRAEFEAIITAPAISGKRLYVGEATRPNTLTWVITLNGVSLATDMAQRSVIVEINRPPRSGTWEEDTYRFIDANRERIIADVLAFLRGPRASLAEYSRWASWEKDVLARLPEPGDAQRLILERQGAADVEREDQDTIEVFFRDRLKRLGYDPEQDRVRIPTAVATRWVNWATNENRGTTAASRMLGAAIEEGRLGCLTRDPCKTFGRGFLWCGTLSGSDRVACNDLADRINLHGDHKPLT
jgi:hypothetical protein